MQYRRSSGARSSRNRKSSKSSFRGWGGWLLVALLFGATVYFGAAGALGDWMAKNIIAPILNPSQASPTPLGTSPTPPADATPTPDQSQITGELKMDPMSIYCIQSGVFSSNDNAAVDADALKKRGGAGYIIQDGDKFRVLVAAYEKEEDARSIKDRLAQENGMETALFTLTVPGMQCNLTATQVQTDALKSGFESWRAICLEMNRISLQYDAKTMDLAQAHQAIDALSEQMRTTASGLSQVFVTGSDPLGSGLRTLYTDALDRLAGLENEASLSGALRYQFIKMVDDYSKFVKSVSTI